MLIIDRGVNVRAAQNRVAAKQIRDRIVDPPVALGLLVRRLWRFRWSLRARRTGCMRAGRRWTILATQGCGEDQESGECGERENESAGHDWASLRGTATVWHGSATGFNVSAGQSCWPDSIKLAGARPRFFRHFSFRRLGDQSRAVVIREICPGPFDHHKQAI